MVEEFLRRRLLNGEYPRKVVQPERLKKYRALERMCADGGRTAGFGFNVKLSGLLSLASGYKKTNWTRRGV